MVFQRFVQIGRLSLINFGKQQGKVVVILDIVDKNRVIVEGPGVPRRVLSVKRITLTPHVVSIPRGVRSGLLLKKLEEQKTVELFQQSSWGKKLAHMERRKELTDFERFKVAHLKRQRAMLINKAMGKLRAKK
ncbi:Ribosomal protein L14 like protein [Aduncisulcus paluster]|uniref:Ribosomal protein L14 like protein n=1 Tax=Aduncisulcus paluster TaxID=2918883 RepID=A0ABQ5K1K8_9EUKA|nr:Ribosomal protein L14 like protein [Aduncisulcus paluster]|eukprot:gnl/Carplike_NY0171/134_a187_5797.p1 GENE.gnl/Carplike_NY0171/134_a187_5797~~gnl/Carplike_NY0171/134_a187_5797.p1  ORF type:complete len:133 (-),score=51.48 gnl/Carplike_NY0171/134_a187_5797:33-431(-)